MRKVYISFILGILFTSNAFASDIGKALGRANVSQLQLIANNLNVMFLFSKAQESMQKEKPKSDSDISNTLTKYSTSKDYRLIVEDFYKAPVTKVTNKECGELLGKLEGTVSGDGSSFDKFILMLSASKLSEAQAKEIAKEAYLVVYVQAEENSQLSLNCHN